MLAVDILYYVQQDPAHLHQQREGELPAPACRSEA